MSGEQADRLEALRPDVEQWAAEHAKFSNGHANHPEDMDIAAFHVAKQVADLLGIDYKTLRQS